MTNPKTNPSTLTAKPTSRALTCPRCGTSFSCDLSGQCWCAAETAKLPMPVSGEDCFCPKCLRAEAERAIRDAASSR